MEPQTVVNANAANMSSDDTQQLLLLLRRFKDVTYSYTEFGRPVLYNDNPLVLAAIEGVIVAVDKYGQAEDFWDEEGNWL